jgi:hypothetical protein
MSAPTSARPDYYIPLPLRLIDDLRNSPLAVGVYSLVARLFRATRAAVPLSPADLRAFDEELSHGAATRALQRLVGTDYLIAIRRPGHKSAYIPTWGLVAGERRRWELAQACLGRPRHIREVRLPQRLLDTCVGRLDPHPLHPGRVTRYTTTALLGLAEVGAYALAMAGLPVANPTLEALGLLTDTKPEDLPDDASILALASQRRLWDAGSPLALSAAGWARTAFAPAAAPKAAIGQPLFFVSKDQIAQSIDPMIAHPISDQAPAQARNTAYQRPRGRAVAAAAGSHVDESQKEINTTTQTHTQGLTQAGGGEFQTSGSRMTESEQSLRQLGVRGEVARSLADRPAALVNRLISQAQARPDVRDRAAWVVSALRALPAETSPVTPAVKVSDLAILTHRGLANHERTRWLTRFRNAEPADRPAVLARFHQEHPHDAMPAKNAL